MLEKLTLRKLTKRQFLTCSNVSAKRRNPIDAALQARRLVEADVETSQGLRKSRSMLRTLEGSEVHSGRGSCWRCSLLPLAGQSHLWNLLGWLPLAGEAKPRRQNLLPVAGESHFRRRSVLPLVARRSLSWLPLASEKWQRWLLLAGEVDPHGVRRRQSRLGLDLHGFRRR